MKWSIPDRIITRGREYLNEGRVLSVIQDWDKQVWYGEVLGTELYLVELDGSPKEQDKCECSYWLEQGYCKHTVAVELYLRSKGIPRVMTTSRPAASAAKKVSSAEMFTKGFAKFQKEIEESSQSSLIVEYLVENIQTNAYYPEFALLGISLRVGIQDAKKRTYIIKNIGDFLQKFIKEETYSVSKQHIFRMVHNSFSEQDLLILNQLASIYQTSQLLGVKGLQVKGKMDKRYLLLPIEQSKELLEQMNQTNSLQLILDDHKIRHINFSANELPLKFVVERTADDQYKLVIGELFSPYLSHYHWGIFNQIIYILSREQEEIYSMLIQLLKRMERSEIIYEQIQLSELFSSVVPLLKKIGDVQIDDEVKHKLIVEPLDIQFIFKKRKEKLDVRVDYHYGNMIFSTDPAQNTSTSEGKEIIRDIRKETAAVELLKQLSYTENETGFERRLPSGERLYYFFKVEIPLFRKLGEVLMGKKLRELYLDAQSHQPTIEITDADSWLDVRFDIAGVNENEIDAALASLLRNDSFYALESGEILSFDSEEFYQTSEVLSKLRENMKNVQGKIQLPKNQGLIIEQMLGDNSRAVFSDSFRQLSDDLTHPENYEAELPKTLQAVLRKYQVEGFRWLKMLSHYGFGGILADEMGLGKTVQMIAYLLSEKEELKMRKPALIIAPASLIYNWSAELKKFSPGLKECVITGQKAERLDLLENGEDQDILITSYNSFRQDVESYEQMNLGYLVLDEAQMVKNSGTKTAQALRKLDVPQRFALSGTPIENSLDELWSVFQIVLPGFFPQKMIFRELATEEVARMIRPFILRRDKKNVLADLPDKIENNLYSTLTEEQKAVYLAYLRKMQEDISQMDNEAFKKNRISILAGLTRLRQICCDPRLFMDDYYGSSGKLEQVKVFLQTAKENKRRVLLFSQFTSMLSILEKELNELGLETFYLRGSTKPKDRLEMVNSFNEGEKDVFLISLKAGGTGLNLVGADTVVLYDLWWNPAVEEQAAGRAHRMGQKKVVEVYRMIAEGTIEEKMDQLQQEKRELFQKVIQGNEQQLGKLTEEDIRTILSMGDE
ncbi:DEAD/DEAH box helicase [Enterococcus sp. BWB1-3]|uniref:DEAD/DEAH box helicase n=1 Tax=unclassified Enterococcus TaxID=2608891 RepID=UPI00192457F9|nr:MULTISPECIES: DEAD/DEAH box helicase [unclassified Enterococcus]MBL1229762.1 DEAD/DEAH box helicase [Enterococcus sp. BWB1-3]MCB5956260.1 DEAD/DEAH box helicase [Enterococcus sp. CWB-B31]